MEIVLNLVWILLAVVLVRLWLHYAPRNGVSLRTQVAALAMLIVILFPVISVTDDLQIAQNPAELDCCARRNHAVSCSHSIHPMAASISQPVYAEPSFGFLGFVGPLGFPVPTVDNPALAPIQNRPPPAA